MEGDLVCKGLPEDCTRELGRDAALASFARVRTYTKANGELRWSFVCPAVSPPSHKTSTILYLLIFSLAQGLMGALHATFHDLPRLSLS